MGPHVRTGSWKRCDAGRGDCGRVGDKTCQVKDLKRPGWPGRKGDNSRKVTGSRTVKGLVRQSEVLPGKPLYSLGHLREVA